MFEGTDNVGEGVFEGTGEPLERRRSLVLETLKCQVFAPVVPESAILCATLGEAIPPRKCVRIVIRVVIHQIHGH